MPEALSFAESHRQKANKLIFSNERCCLWNSDIS
jgi:hypothetical protein